MLIAALWGFRCPFRGRLALTFAVESSVHPGVSAHRPAIRGSDLARLTRIPGVGKKLAERLVVELKDKLDDFAVAPVATGVKGAAVEDVLSALVNLGYQRPAAEKAIEQAVSKDAALAGDFDGLFRGALKVIR